MCFDSKYNISPPLVAIAAAARWQGDARWRCASKAAAVGGVGTAAGYGK